jgi:hypothetical protein
MSREQLELLPMPPSDALPEGFAYQPEVISPDDEKRGPGRWRRVSLRVDPRSAYLLSGAARWTWEHSIPPVDSLRYSITFRNRR